MNYVPPNTGLIVADRYGGAIVRPSPVAQIHASRRKAVTLRFAKVAAERLAMTLELRRRSRTASSEHFPNEPHQSRRSKRSCCHFPGAVERPSYGKPVFLIAKKFFTRLRAEDDSLVLFVGSIDERDMLLEAEPALFHITDHYKNYPTVLVRIEKARRAKRARHAGTPLERHRAEEAAERANSESE